MTSLIKLLEDKFGYDSFRTGQEELIQGILSGQDCLGIMPTGGGKSVCYQLPALVLEGLTLVVSPLISLMKDQVDALNEIGIPATYINSTLTYREIKARLGQAARGEVKLLYVAPERMESSDFIELTNHVSVDLIAIDEAKARLLEDLQNATEIAAIGEMVHGAHRIVDIGGRGVAMAIGVRFPALELIMRFLELDAIEGGSHVVAGIVTVRRGEEARLH